MNFRLLIFDDDSPELNPLKILLQAKGYEIHTYSDPLKCPLITGDEVVSNGVSFSTDFIISNFSTPLNTNLQFIEDLKRKKFKVNNIAILSSGCREKDINKAVELGCRVFPKPIKLSTVLSWLDEREKNIPPDRKLLNYK